MSCTVRQFKLNESVMIYLVLIFFPNFVVVGIIFGSQYTGPGPMPWPVIDSKTTGTVHCSVI